MKIINCTACNKTFIDKSNYNKHIKSKQHLLNESGKKIKGEFQCDFCDYKTKHSSNFKKHTLNHRKTPTQLLIMRPGLRGKIKKLEGDLKYEKNEENIPKIKEQIVKTKQELNKLAHSNIEKKNDLLEELDAVTEEILRLSKHKIKIKELINNNSSSTTEKIVNTKPLAPESKNENISCKIQKKKETKPLAPAPSVNSIVYSKKDILDFPHITASNNEIINLINYVENLFIKNGLKLSDFIKDTTYNKNNRKSLERMYNEIENVIFEEDYLTY